MLWRKSQRVSKIEQALEENPEGLVDSPPAAGGGRVSAAGGLNIDTASF